MSVTTLETTAAPVTQSEQNPVAGQDTSVKTGEDTAPVFDPMTSELADPIYSHPEAYKGITKEELEALPPRVKMLVHNMRVDYTKKSQQREEAVKTRLAELEARERALQQNEATLNEIRRRTMEAGNNSEYLAQLRQKAEAQDLPDLFDEGGIAAKIEQEVARRITEMNRPFQEEMEQQVQQARMEAARSRFEEAKRTLPMFEELGPRMVKLVEELKVDTLTAHKIAYGEHLAAKEQERQQSQQLLAEERRQSERNVGKPTSVSATVTGARPAHLRTPNSSIYDYYEYFKTHGTGQ